MEFRITHFKSLNEYSTSESRSYDEKEEDIISADAINLLFHYRQAIGVSCVRKIKGVISWELNNQWFSSNEIERILKIKSFS